jgi:drug/metabolite transporter (DMT)-like permease
LFRVAVDSLGRIFASFREHFIMSKTAILGIVLIFLGIAGFLLGHFSYTETKPVLKAGPLQVNSEEQHTISFPTIGSGLLLLAGVLLVVTGRKAAS